MRNLIKKLVKKHKNESNTQYYVRLNKIERKLEHNVKCLITYVVAAFIIVGLLMSWLLSPVESYYKPDTNGYHMHVVGNCDYCNEEY